LIHVPSETENEIAIWYPEQQIMFSAETINPTFPNCYTIRGTPYRDVVRWYRSIDRMREYDPEHMVPSHGNPVLGQKNVDYVITVSRDIIQFVHDQTVKLMNQSYRRDDLAEVIVLLHHLESIKPYGRQYYATVKHVVRSIYDGWVFGLV
jgi:alkyl sulfatase BDS1-like metallo-beta-lactamase superfamily hydrolase